LPPRQKRNWFPKTPFGLDSSVFHDTTGKVLGHTTAKRVFGHSLGHFGLRPSHTFSAGKLFGALWRCFSPGFFSPTEPKGALGIWALFVPWGVGPPLGKQRGYSPGELALSFLICSFFYPFRVKGFGHLSLLGLTFGPFGGNRLPHPRVFFPLPLKFPWGPVSNLVSKGAKKSPYMVHTLPLGTALNP